jgi:hypothetical protein
LERLSAIVKERLKAAGFKTRGSIELLGVKGGFKLPAPAPAINFYGSSRDNSIHFQLNLGAYLSNVEDVMASYRQFQNEDNLRQYPHLAGLAPKRPIPWLSLTLLSHTEEHSFLINDDQNRASLAMLVERSAARLPTYRLDTVIEKLGEQVKIEPSPNSALGVASRAVIIRDLYRANLPDNQYLLDWIEPIEPPDAATRVKLSPFIDWWSRRHRWE